MVRIDKGAPPDFKCKQCGKCCLNLGDAFETCATAVSGAKKKEDEEKFSEDRNRLTKNL